MNFFEIVQTVRTTIQDHAVKFVTGLVLMTIGWWIGKWRAQKNWKKQEFFDRLNFSLNTLEKGVLKIRTLSEKRCEDVFLNSVASDTVQKLARRTTEKDPMLAIPINDTWYYLNAILNELSEQFAVGLLRRDLGAPTQSAIYIIALTCEAAGEVRTRKVRAMVIQKSVLATLPAEIPKLEAPNHSTRWETLRFLSTEYAKNPTRFLEVELCV